MITVDHYDRFFVLATVGLGLMLAGGLNLALGGRSGRRCGLRAVLNSAVCAAAAGCLTWLARGELAVRGAGLLEAILLAVVLFNSERLQRGLAALVGVARRPAARWGVLTVGGLALVLGSVVGFEHTEEAATERNTLELELSLGSHPSRPVERGHAVTDRGHRIVLQKPQTPREGECLSTVEERMLRATKLGDQVIRRGGPTDGSNCHGWVFTGGQFLLDAEAVETTLKDNGYAETHDPHPGDVAIYRLNGSLTHSALVRYVTAGQPVLVESKWGALGVFLHPADKSPYGTDVTFYHSARSGHLLVGLDGPGSRPAVEDHNATAE